MSIKINENITLHYIPMQKLKTSSMGVYIHRPLCKEEAAYNGLLPFVLKRGCKKAPTVEEMSKYLDNLYGASIRAGVLKKGLDQVITFTCDSISEKYTPFDEPIFDDLTDLLVSVLLEPVIKDGGFSPDFVEQEKKNNIEQLESIINDKRSYAALKCARELYKGTDLEISKLGTVEDIKNITPQSLFEHYKKVISESPVDIVLSGEWDEERIAEKLKTAFSSVIFKNNEIRKTEPYIKKRDIQRVTEKLNVSQGKLSMGFITGVTSEDDDEYWSMMVANSIFGGGAHSKLFNNVREKLSLCYYASSGLDRYTGVLNVNAGIEFENFQKAYDEILVQLKELQSGNVSELEYVSSINAIVNSLKSCRDDQYAMQSFYLSEKVSGTGRELDYVIDKIKNVSVDMAVKASQKIKLDTVYFLTGEGEV